MTTRFEGKVAVVTGAGRGIGRAVALLLATEGASVVVNDLGCDVDGSGHSRLPADSVVDEIRAAGGQAVASYENVSRMEDGERVVQSALDTFGRIDILVNSVAVLRDRLIHQMTSEEFGLVVNNNVKGTFVPTRFAAIQFRQQRGGRIVNMTSDAGLGAFGSSSYAAASEAIVGLTRTVARDMGRYGVTCNAISPIAATRLFPGTVAEVREARAPGITPARRAGIPESPAAGEWDGPGGIDDPSNVAALAALLCSDAIPNANGYVFGVRRGVIFLYSNPTIERSVHRWGGFDMAAVEADWMGVGF